MSDSEVCDGNILIAEFMGGKEWLLKTHWKGIYSIEYHQWFPSELNFHSSWDWLMPVIQKIEATKNYGVRVQITTDGTSIILYLKEGTKSFDYSAKNSKIESVWLSVTTFIKWHNSQNSALQEPIEEKG